jgi:hypothetical protein
LISGHIVIIDITDRYTPTIPQQLCKNWFFFILVAVGWIYSLLLMNLMLRVYALYKRDSRILFLLVFLNFVKVGNLIVSWYIFLPAFGFMPNCMPTVLKPVGGMACSS